ncbi:hypothetical protein HNQ03_002603 [Chryseobacterium sp. 16F]|uniref:Uncharacterized protein n=1 Tax=Frigoriflavimonas asaccharolytica TaxID=2735899 RepID=A0A8J8K9V9_9FLAO|nr:hypothetical protein [Frigoriflavimonas asaccharolytica]
MKVKDFMPNKTFAFLNFKVLKISIKLNLYKLLEALYQGFVETCACL